MRIRLSKEVIKQLKRLKKQDIKLFILIQKQLIFFAQNPKHHSLRLHRLTGKLKHMWSISITKNVRMVYMVLKHDEAYFIDLGTHDEVYRK